MIRHIVMWDVRGCDAQERRASAELVKQAFLSLRGVIPGLLFLDVGIHLGEEPYACDVVLVTDFVDCDALALYTDHPEHLRIRIALDSVRTARHHVDYVME